MKITHLLRHTASGAIALGAIALLPSLHAQFTTGFESSEGYTDGATIIGVNDGSIPGSAVWTDSPWGPGVIASSANPQTGDMALRIVGTGAGRSIGANIDLAGSGVSFSTDPVRFSLGISIGAGWSAGTGNQLQIYLGSVGVGDAAKHWLTLMFSEGNFFLYYDNVAGTATSPLALGGYTTFADYGSYITFDAVIDPVSKTYISGSMTGSKGTVDFTSSIADRALPWLSATAGDPEPFFTVLVGGNDTITVDIDNFSLSNIPEPSTYAMVLGLVGLAGAVALRRRR